MSKLETVNGKLMIDGKPVIKGWESFSGWYWFALEKSEERKIGSEGGGSVIDGREVDDVIWFGFVQGQEEEYGYFSEAEIKSLGKYRVWLIKKDDLPSAGRRGRL